jgi:hypothetical protein
MTTRSLPSGLLASDLPLDVLRNMDIRVDPWSPTPCTPTNALRMFAAHAHTCTPYVKSAQEPRTRQNEWHTRQSERRSEFRGAGPVPPDRRARLQCSADFDTYACGELEDSAKIRKYWDDWHLSRPHRVG